MRSSLSCGGRMAYGMSLCEPSLPLSGASRVQRCLNKLEVRTERRWRGGQRAYWGWGQVSQGLDTAPWRLHSRFKRLPLCLIKVICFLLDYTWCFMPGWGPCSIWQIWLEKRGVILGGIWFQRSLAASEIRISIPRAGLSILFVLSIHFKNIPTFDASHLWRKFLFNITHACSAWNFCIALGWKW